MLQVHAVCADTERQLGRYPEAAAVVRPSPEGPSAYEERTE
ncbi:hypothetical protein [Streptomyces torulosus]|nr:hypothetical protein [Streptomyces torulosus]